MATDYLQYLANYMFSLSASVPNKVNAIKQTLAVLILEGVVKGTPVDTGKARSNWIVSIGSDNTITELDAYSPMVKGGINESANADAAIEYGEAAIAQVSPGEQLWIQNNVRYVPYLNYPPAHSPQADAFFVETAVSEAVNQFAGVRIVFNTSVFSS